MRLPASALLNLQTCEQDKSPLLFQATKFWDPLLYSNRTLDTPMANKVTTGA